MSAGRTPRRAWKRQYRYRKQYVFKGKVGRSIYRIKWTGIKWTRTGGWSWTRTSWRYVSSYRIVYTKG
ncbi:hypothetical protein ACQEV4_12710 [Streptomyces shenzhenensis]|uniref:hypothetical protein n=1 Tax=Streptomyces shenzhenensis TaxID=943815 RepID=UPI003D945FB6